MIEELRSKHLNDMLNSTSSMLAYFGYKNHMIVIYDDDDPRISGLTIKGKTVKPVQMIAELLESLPKPLKKQVVDALKEKYKRQKNPYEVLMNGYFNESEFE
jgi:hypothetical protein